MNISCVVIDLANKLNLSEFVAYIKNTCGQNSEILYCSSNKFENESVKNYVFKKDECTEKIINTILKKCTKNNILIIRDVNLYKNSENLIKELKRSNQVIAYKKQQNKFKDFFLKLFNSTIGKLYMKNLHAIDHGIVLYGETASKVLKSVNYPSILCKTNNWTGIQIKQLQSNGSNYKFKYNFKKALIYTIAPFTVALLMLIIRLAVGFKMFLTLEILYWAVFFLILVVGLVFASKLVVKSSIGDNVRDKAKYL